MPPESTASTELTHDGSDESALSILASRREQTVAAQQTPASA